jgi:hypothetical protein
MVWTERAPAPPSRHAVAISKYLWECAGVAAWSSVSARPCLAHVIDL